jgi:hypothetical protein
MLTQKAPQSQLSMQQPHHDGRRIAGSVGPKIISGNSWDSIVCPSVCASSINLRFGFNARNKKISKRVTGVKQAKLPATVGIMSPEPTEVVITGIKVPNVITSNPIIKKRVEPLLMRKFGLNPHFGHMKDFDTSAGKRFDLFFPNAFSKFCCRHWNDSLALLNNARSDG